CARRCEAGLRCWDRTWGERQAAPQTGQESGLRRRPIGHSWQPPAEGGGVGLRRRVREPLDFGRRRRIGTRPSGCERPTVVRANRAGGAMRLRWVWNERLARVVGPRPLKRARRLNRDRGL